MLFTLLILPTISLVSQEEPDDLPWLFEQYDAEEAQQSDWESIGERISDLANEGYLPVGFELRPRPSVLYIRNEGLPFTQWTIHEFEDPQNFEANFGAFLDEGWLPMDIARSENGIVALFVGAESSINGWRLTGVEMDSEAIAEEIAGYREEGFTPWGLTPTEGGVWILLLREAGTVATDTSIQSYPADDVLAISEGVTSEILHGNFIPWGLMIHGETATVQYIRSEEHQPDFDPDELQDMDDDPGVLNPID